jgi:protein-L-isoaspartate(D-aspartate) O-methyltransferase
MTKERPKFPLNLSALGAKKSILNPSQKLSHPVGGQAMPLADNLIKRAKSNSKKPLFESPSGLGLDSSAVREHMVKKLAAQGFDDPFVLAAMSKVERHRFVDSALVNQAYEDTSLPIGLGQTISKPNVVARMLELLRQGNNISKQGKLGRVLEIGTGCGYQAAVLSKIATEVYSIERLRGLYERAKENLRPLLIPNLHLIFGDGMLGYSQGAPYSGIIAAAGGESIPQQWLDQLAVGGRIVAPIQGPVEERQDSFAHGAQTIRKLNNESAESVEMTQRPQALIVIDRTENGFEQKLLEAVHFVPLKSGIN